MADRGCIFCGGTPTTREHLWPNWLQLELDIREQYPHRLEQEEDGVETRDVSFDTPPFNQQVKAVCAACNSGWMSDIERSAQALLRRLMRAGGRRLHRREQRTLAAWAFLKACMFDELHPAERVVPVEHREYLYEHQRPPADGLWILLATYEARDVGHYAYQGLKLQRGEQPPPAAPTLYVVTITIGALVIQVIGSVLEDWRFAPAAYPPELDVAQIWPSSSSVEFAQRNVMSHDTLIAFTKALYNVMGRFAGGAPAAR